MKHTLKNRPRAESVFKGPDGKFYEVTAANFEAWCKAFEQELRDRLKNYGGGLILNDFIREILGEEAS